MQNFDTDYKKLIILKKIIYIRIFVCNVIDTLMQSIV